MSDTTYFNIEATGSTGDNSCGPCLKVIRREYEARIAALRSLVESLEEVKADQKARIATLEAQVEQAREALEEQVHECRMANDFGTDCRLHYDDGIVGPRCHVYPCKAVAWLQALREGGTVSEFQEEELYGAIARGWCDKRNSGKEMDVDLADAIAVEVLAVVRPLRDRIATLEAQGARRERGKDRCDDRKEGGMTLDRTAARARCEAATPGPWEKYDQNDGMEMVFGALWCIANDAYMNPPDEDSDDPWEAVDIMIATGIEADADFTAHARTDLPAALDDLDAKDAEIERLKELMGEFEWTVRTHDMCFRKGSKAQLLAARARAALEGRE